MDYFTSDLHFSHANILKFQNRPFDSVESMDCALLNNINSTVSRNDTLYVLGDFVMGRGVDKKERAREVLSKIICNNVILVIGNHDIKMPNELKAIGFSDAFERLEIKEDENRLVLDHYPMMEWDAYYRGSYHLHGHIHSDPSYNEDMRRRGILRYDVGVDANDYRPVSWLEIKSFFAEVPSGKRNRRGKHEHGSQHH